jgi:hypothetical protein
MKTTFDVTRPMELHCMIGPPPGHPKPYSAIRYQGSALQPELRAQRWAVLAASAITLP